MTLFDHVTGESMDCHRGAPTGLFSDLVRSKYRESGNLTHFAPSVLTQAKRVAGIFPTGDNSAGKPRAPRLLGP
jgi:hypothetical protein